MPVSGFMHSIEADCVNKKILKRGSKFKATMLIQSTGSKRNCTGGTDDKAMAHVIEISNAQMKERYAVQ